MTPSSQHSHVSHVGEGLHSLSQVVELHNSRTDVQSLNLHSNAIQAIDGLHNLPKLVSLNLSSNSIRLVENLSGLVHLTSLNLASNSISELRELEGLSKLQQLNVSYNLITSIQGITALHGSSGSLTRLNLQHNQLPSLQALAPLAGCLHLQQLKVGGNPCTLTPAAYAALRQALPQVQQLDESEAVSLAASWQMAHAQLQAFDAGQQQHLQKPQQQSLMPPAQQVAHASTSKDGTSAGQHGSGRSPKHHTRRPAPEPEQECSTSSSQSSMEGVEPSDTEAVDSGQRQSVEPQQQDPGSSSKAKAGAKAALASPSKRAKAAVSQSESGVQTDDYISAAEVELVTEAQDLRQQLSRLAGEGGGQLKLCCLDAQVGPVPIA